MQRFQLVPFARDDATAGMQIGGRVERTATRLRVHYDLRGDRSRIVVPTPVAAPGRRDGLWQTTCFELFVAPRAAAGYVEVNASPSGDWAAYTFAAYRDGMAALPGSPVRTSCQVHAAQGHGDAGDGVLRLDLDLDLAPIAWATGDLDLAVTAIVELRDPAKTYWALSHCATCPDFHQRASFTLQI